MERITTSEVQVLEKEHYARLRALAPECMVLLKKNGDFPLSAPCEIALYGSGARRTVKGGTGSGDVNVRHFTTVEEGLENAGFSITTKAWLNAYDALYEKARETFYDEILEESARTGMPAFLLGIGRMPKEPEYTLDLAGPGEVCIYVLSRNSGEGSDRPGGKGDLELSEVEIRDIRRCAEQYKKFLLVLNVGGPVDLSLVLDSVDNILLLSQLGSVTGDAFADVLLGKTSPSGKLTATWAKTEDYPTVGDFAASDDTCYREGIYVGYRWFDANGFQPLFPFGCGMSYTEFESAVHSFSVENGAVKVEACVKNIGCFAGKETLQLWYSAPDGRLKKPRRELGAYAKTGELLPGQSEMLTLMLPLENMASWDTEQSAWVLEKGDYVISLGNQPIGIVELPDDMATQRLSASCGDADFEDWQPDTGRTVPCGLLRIPFNEKLTGHFDRDRIRGQSFNAPELSSFTEEELALSCVGKFKAASGVAAIIGNSSYRVAGAAGETADVIEAKGFGKLILADGPAGVRLTTRYVEQAEGALGLDAGSFESIMRLFPEPLQQLIKVKTEEAKKLAETETVYYHYASAIPIGTALAQTWNDEACETCGDLVGDEMERFGVNVWLAPALNIQRSPLCGRNFEYYSEDPVLSGKTAAAITRGVQRHPGCAVTVKHFACNNQETNRFGSNSIVSQRALREIYLKGFEICVKESAPKALMSSYNLLNGTHTANRRDLLTDILRDEWAFSGFVMTDWSTTGNGLNKGKYGPSSAAQCIRAGNDLIMPGSRADVDGILDGLKTGKLTWEELAVCAGRIIAAAQNLCKQEASK